MGHWKRISETFTALGRKEDKTRVTKWVSPEDKREVREEIYASENFEKWARKWVVGGCGMTSTAKTSQQLDEWLLQNHKCYTI